MIIRYKIQYAVTLKWARRFRRDWLKASRLTADDLSTRLIVDSLKYQGDELLKQLRFYAAKHPWK